MCNNTEISSLLWLFVITVLLQKQIEEMMTESFTQTLTFII